MGLDKFQVSGPRIYVRTFDESEEGPFEVPASCTNFGVIIKPVYDAPKLCVFQEINSDCVFCSLSSAFFFVDEKVAADCFKDEIIPYF